MVDNTEILIRIQRSLDELLRLAKVSMLEDGKYINFPHFDEDIRMCLPNAAHDFVQKRILMGNTFFELPLLKRVETMNVVGPESTVLDIGANIGNHSVYFGKVLKAGQVISVEPQNRVFPILSENLELNGLDASNARKMLIGPTDGFGEMKVFVQQNLGQTQFQPSDSGDVPMTTLDRLVSEASLPVTMVKIDVEGMEWDVLSGGMTTIADTRPVFWIEILKEDEENYERIETLFKEHRYRVSPMSPNDFLFIPFK